MVKRLRVIKEFLRLQAAEEKRWFEGANRRLRLQGQHSARSQLPCIAAEVKEEPDNVKAALLSLDDLIGRHLGDAGIRLRDAETNPEACILELVWRWHGFLVTQFQDLTTPMMRRPEKVCGVRNDLEEVTDPEGLQKVLLQLGCTSPVVTALEFVAQFALDARKATGRMLCCANQTPEQACRALWAFVDSGEELTTRGPQVGSRRTPYQSPDSRFIKRINWEATAALACNTLNNSCVKDCIPMLAAILASIDFAKNHMETLAYHAFGKHTLSELVKTYPGELANLAVDLMATVDNLAAGGRDTKEAHRLLFGALSETYAPEAHVKMVGMLADRISPRELATEADLTERKLHTGHDQQFHVKLLAVMARHDCHSAAAAAEKFVWDIRAGNTKQFWQILRDDSGAVIELLLALLDENLAARDAQPGSGRIHRRMLAWMLSLLSSDGGRLGLGAMQVSDEGVAHPRRPRMALRDRLWKLALLHIEDGDLRDKVSGLFSPPESRGWWRNLWCDYALYEELKKHFGLDEVDEMMADEVEEANQRRAFEELAQRQAGLSWLKKAQAVENAEAAGVPRFLAARGFKTEVPELWEDYKVADAVLELAEKMEDAGNLVPEYHMVDTGDLVSTMPLNMIEDQPQQHQISFGDFDLDFDPQAATYASGGDNQQFPHAQWLTGEDTFPQELDPQGANHQFQCAQWPTGQYYYTDQEGQTGGIQTVHLGTFESHHEVARGAFETYHEIAPGQVMFGTSEQAVRADQTGPQGLPLEQRHAGNYTPVPAELEEETSFDLPPSFGTLHIPVFLVVAPLDTAEGTSSMTAWPPPQEVEAYVAYPADYFYYEDLYYEVHAQGPLAPFVGSPPWPGTGESPGTGGGVVYQ